MKVRKPEEAKTQNTPLVPKYKIDYQNIPSKGYFYPEGEIYIKPYTFGEIKYLSQSELSYLEEIKFILQGTETTFDKDKLTFFDFLFLALLRKLHSFGTDEYQIKFSCTCGKELQKVFSTQDIEFVDLINPDKEFLTLELNDTKFKVSLLRLEKVFLTKEDKPDLLALHIDMPYKQAKEFVDNLLPVEVVELENIIEKYFYHGIKPLQIKCDKCNKVIQVDLLERGELIKPFRRDRQSSKIRILDT